MKTLLGASIYRKVMLLELLDRLSDWCPAKEATTLINCSIKTLLTDIDYINDFWGEYIHIEYSKFQGVRLNNLTSNKLDNVYSLIFNDCDEFQFIERILFDPNEDAEYWINHLFVSEASFYRMVSAIEKFLEKRGLLLERNPFRITAKDERWVRFFYQQYFTEAYGMNRWPFKVDHQGAFGFVTDMAKMLDLVLNNQEIQEDAFLLLISIIRFNHGFTLSENMCLSTNDAIEEEIRANKTTIESFLLNTAYTLENEWWAKEISQTVFHEFYTWDNPEQTVRVTKKIEEFLQRMELAVEYPLPEDDKKKILQKMCSWYVNYNFYPYKKTLLFVEQSRFAQEIKQTYPIFYRLAYLYLEDIDKKNSSFWLELFLDDTVVLLMQEWTGIQLRLEHLRKKVSIIVVSSLGEKHAQMLRDDLFSKYGDRVALNIYNEPLLFCEPKDIEIFEAYALIISNNPIKNYTKDNYLVVNDFFSSSDRENIFHHIINIQTKERENQLKKLTISYLKSGASAYSYVNEKKNTTH